MTRISRGNPELDFRRQVIDLANLYGWEHVGFRPAKTEEGWRTPVTGTMGKGWPDLTLARTRDRRLIFAELKSDEGRLSPEQRRVLELLGTLNWAAACGEFPRGLHEGELWGAERRHECCPPVIETYLWRPRDFDVVKATLQ